MPTPSPARIHDFEVVSNTAIADGIYALVITAPALAQQLKPGQFVNIRVPGSDSELLRVPLSYAFANNDQGTVEIWYAVVGSATKRMSAWKPGLTSDLLGPGGKGWTAPKDAKRALLVAGGIGVPPVLCLANQLCSAGIAVDMCIGAASAAKLVGVQDATDLGCASVSVATDDGTRGTHGFCTDNAAAFLNEHTHDYIAACGPAPMMKKVAELAQQAQTYCEVSVERMMSCGFGACGTCNVETIDGMQGACMCGPVFDASKVVVF